MKKIFSLSVVCIMLISGCDSKTTINTTTPSNPSPISSSSGTTNNANFFKVKAVITQRCTTCHATNASDPSAGSPASGISLETDAQIQSEARNIQREVVQRRTMPYQNNKTGITEDERALIGNWVSSGASIN
ncbi:MAG: hypothetical protein H7263_04760 [Candidatus Sericytochromatia bacterium]|nr:hypothetical protein [Candidatus Sericytochromatia bacterium]